MQMECVHVETGSHRSAEAFSNNPERGGQFGSVAGILQISFIDMKEDSKSLPFC